MMLSLVTGVWAAAWILFAASKLVKGERHLVLPVLIVHNILTGLPLLLDVLLGRPPFLQNPGFRLANNDYWTNVIYCGYVAAVSPVLWRFGRGKLRAAADKSPWRIPSIGTQLLLVMAVFSPFLLLAISPDAAIYSRYGAALGERLGTEVAPSYTYIAILSRISILATGILLLMTKRPSGRHFLIAAPWIVGSLWLIGKRADVALALLVMIYVVWQKKLVKGPKFVVLCVSAIIAMGVFSFAYQTNLRSDAADGAASSYETFRVDYGRDSQIRMSIFAQLHPDQMKILEYPGQSYLFDATFFVPRQAWNNKPLPYAQYFTSAMFRHAPKDWGWGMTTSWLDESISNFGFFGFLLGPITLAMYCRFGDHQRSVSVRFLTVVIACLLLAVQLAAFLPLALLWIGAVQLGRRSERRSTSRSAGMQSRTHNEPGKISSGSRREF